MAGTVWAWAQQSGGVPALDRLLGGDLWFGQPLTTDAGRAGIRPAGDLVCPAQTMPSHLSASS